MTKGTQSGTGGGGGGGIGSRSGLYVGMKEVQGYCDYDVDSYTNTSVNNTNNPTTTVNPTTTTKSTTINPTTINPTTINHASVKHHFVTRGGYMSSPSLSPTHPKEAHTGLVSLMAVDMLIAAGDRLPSSATLPVYSPLYSPVLSYSSLSPPVSSSCAREPSNLY